jgi:predicted acylesterase/phospholipase RssA
MEEVIENTITTENTDQDSQKPTIKHLVISGGGATGFAYYGILKETNRKEIWKFENIESIWGTSIGAILAVLMCLNYEWPIIDDFLIKRPWQTVFKFNMYSILESYQKRGIFELKSMDDVMQPLFSGKDIPINITMKEFYELTKIELHVFATELTSYTITDFSYKTHPDWKITEVLYCSACLPVMFAPYFKENNCYCDGGLIMNYPLEACIGHGANRDEILGIRRINIKSVTPTTINESSTLLDMIMIILNHYSKKVFVLNKNETIQYEYVVESEQTTLINMYSVFNNMDERIKLIELGVRLVTE